MERSRSSLHKPKIVRPSDRPDLTPEGSSWGGNSAKLLLESTPRKNPRSSVYVAMCQMFCRSWLFLSEFSAKEFVNSLQKLSFCNTFGTSLKRRKRLFRGALFKTTAPTSAAKLARSVAWIRQDLDFKSWLQEKSFSWRPLKSTEINMIENRGLDQKFSDCHEVSGHLVGAWSRIKHRSQPDR